MDIRFRDTDHLNFYRERRSKAEAEGKRVNTYFRPLLYLCGLTVETRSHFDEIFDWEDWSIRPESLSAGWQTGTSLRITRLAFNLWNGRGSDDPECGEPQEEYLPDNLFCCSYMEFFFEAMRLRFPEFCTQAERNFSIIGC